MSLKKPAVYLSAVIGISIILLGILHDQFSGREKTKMSPADWFYFQRAYPNRDINYQVYKDAVIQKISMKKKSAVAGYSWELAGPTNVGGRISDVEMDPNSLDIIYGGAASGGIFKSVDRGVTWTPVFDDAMSLSIGDIAIDPNNSSIVYVGTGEVNCGGGSMTYDGYGVYKSENGGETWTHLGLENTRYIGRIAVDPSNSQKIFLAAMGKLFGYNEERGLYVSHDGGLSWEKSLYINEKTGCIDVMIDPQNPNLVYAAMWERLRTPDQRLYGGAGSGLYKSNDGGITWHELTSGLPHATDDIGRIGISLCSSVPSTLYAFFCGSTGAYIGIYKSVNSGETWSKCTDIELISSWGWWFGNIRVAPDDPETVYYLDLHVRKTNDGGQTWEYSSLGLHVDQHSLYIHPQNPSFFVLGNDGGLYTSANGGIDWQKSSNLPITQFYTCEIEYQNPLRLYGGAQDNGTNRTREGALDDWNLIYGGDGFYVLVDPDDNKYMYAEAQRGSMGRSADGGSTFSYSMTGISTTEPKNWCAPIVLDPSNSATLYFGTNRVYKSTDRAVSWSPISPVLAKDQSGDYTAYGTVTTIDVSPVDNNIIYAGTDDGNVHVTLDGGTNWSLISGTLPDRWITRVTADLFDAKTAYVTISGYRGSEYMPHIFRTSDAGESWEDISGNLPETPLNDVLVDPADRNTLYAAGDIGVFFTKNLGTSWDVLGNDLPNVPVTDIKIHNPSRTLVAATFGRSMYKFDISRISAIEPDVSGPLPAEFSLKQNFPNPFNNETAIRYYVPKISHVSLTIYDITGRLVKNLENRIREKGEFIIKWDGTNNSRVSVSSGIYLLHFQAGNSCSKAMKMTYLK